MTPEIWEKYSKIHMKDPGGDKTRVLHPAAWREVHLIVGKIYVDWKFWQYEN